MRNGWDEARGVQITGMMMTYAPQRRASLSSSSRVGARARRGSEDKKHGRESGDQLPSSRTQGPSRSVALGAKASLPCHDLAVHRRWEQKSAHASVSGFVRQRHALFVQGGPLALVQSDETRAGAVISERLLPLPKAVLEFAFFFL